MQIALTTKIEWIDHTDALVKYSSSAFHITKP
jgi:hypothetical protein